MKIMRSNNYFKHKIDIFKFSKIEEVKDIIKELEEVNSSNFDEYIKEHDIKNKLRLIYWKQIYGTETEFRIVEDILNKTLFNNINYKPYNEVLEDINLMCKSLNKEYLFSKICNTCPNGDSVVNTLIMGLYNEKRDK